MRMTRSLPSARGVRAWLLGAGLAMVLVGSAPARPAGEGEVIGDLRLPDLATRLAALDTSDAQACFLLAEEFAFEFQTEEGGTMARTLFVLAHEADRKPGQHRGLSAHVYIALASMARNETERRMLTALATSDGGSAGPMDAGADAGPGVVSDGALELAEAIGLARAGDGRGVRDRLRKPAVQAALVGLGEDAPFIRRLLENADAAGVCPTCKNRRVIRNQVPGDERESLDTLCPICRGNPGPKLNPDELARTLDAECRLLGSSSSRWSAQHWLDHGRAFQDPDPSELAARYGVDPRRTRWIANPARPGDPFAGAWSAPAK